MFCIPCLLRRIRARVNGWMECAHASEERLAQAQLFREQIKITLDGAKVAEVVQRRR